MRLNRQERFVTPNSKVVGVQKSFFADLAPNEIVVVLDIENSFVAVIRADIIDLIGTILLAANKTF